MPDATPRAANTLFVEVTGSGLPEVDVLYVPSQAPPAKSESGTVSSQGFWNGKMAWDRADVRKQLAAYTDPQRMAQPLSEKAEILLGLRPYPRGE